MQQRLSWSICLFSCFYYVQVKVMRCLDHPNVLKFIGLFYKDKRINFISEYIQGGTLRETIIKMVNLDCLGFSGSSRVHRHSMLITIILLQDKDLPWSTRVSYAKDIAAGMVSLSLLNILKIKVQSSKSLLNLI